MSDTPQGRPPFPEEKRLKKRWIRATDPQYEQWKQAAAKGGEDLSRWMRNTLDRAAKRKLG